MRVLHYTERMLEYMGKTALVVEDDDDIRDLLGIVLGQMGFAVETAGTGEAGLRSARDILPDLVTLDIGLPDMDGVDVLSKLRTFHDGKIVMLTARATAYLLKPFRPASLKNELVAVLER